MKPVPSRFLHLGQGQSRSVSSAFFKASDEAELEARSRAPSPSRK